MSTTRALAPPRAYCQTIVAMLLLASPAVVSGQQTRPAASDATESPDLEELVRLLEQQRNLLDEQAEIITDLRARLDEVESLALSSYNRLAELEQTPPQGSVEGALEERLAELERASRARARLHGVQCHPRRGDGTDGRDRRRGLAFTSTTAQGAASRGFSRILGVHRIRP